MASGATADCRFAIADCRFTDCRLAIADSDWRLPTADCRLPIADCRLPIADCRLPSALPHFPRNNGDVCLMTATQYLHGYSLTDGFFIQLLMQVIHRTNGMIVKPNYDVAGVQLTVIGVNISFY